MSGLPGAPCQICHTGMRSGDGMSAMPGTSLLQANTTSDWESLCSRGVSLCAVGLLNPAMGDHPERVAHLGIQALKRFGQVLLSETTPPPPLPPNIHARTQAKPRTHARIELAGTHVYTVQQPRGR